MFDRFKEVAPTRFINCGIAEANMMSMAVGMGLTGMKPVVYTITPFTTTRCLEQIRTGVAYHDAPVIIVGTGSGLIVLRTRCNSPFTGRYSFVEKYPQRASLRANRLFRAGCPAKTSCG